MTPDVIIIGGGVAGLACARTLHRNGIPFRLLEAADGIGGRVRTDLVGGFRLDRGFQVLLTAYPECVRVLDYAALDLARLEPGALIRRGGRFERLSDPFRRPDQAIASLTARVGTLADRLRILRLRNDVLGPSLDELFARDETTTLDALRAHGFSDDLVAGFFRPFLSGIFLEPELATSSRMFEFVFRMFAAGDAALPALGIGAIPGQLAAALPVGSIQLHTRVESITGATVTTVGGERLTARAIVVATDGIEAARLSGAAKAPAFNGTTCLYFDAPEPPVREPVLVLSADGDGPVNNLCVPSQLAATYAPAGRALVSASVVGIPEADNALLERTTRGQLSGWFGSVVDEWRLLRVYRIPRALPNQSPPLAEDRRRTIRRDLFVCGDHRATGSLHGALTSGRLTGEAVVHALERG